MKPAAMKLFHYAAPQHFYHL
ncbi:MAG: hypothetical protein RI959_1376, partial [Pseudomonadota bacterium]